MRKLAVCTGVLMAIAAVVMASYPSLVKANSDALPIPHGLSGYEKCLICHGTQGMKPVPANHASLTEDSCLGCHSPLAEPSPVSAEPAPVPPETTSSLAEPSSPAAPSPDNSCLSCHNQPGMKVTLANGEKLSVYVDSQTFAKSIHGDKLSCTDCHSSITTYPHPEREIASRRQYTIDQYSLCQSCHFENYTKALDSIHYEVLSTGNLAAPICSDCHGSHEITAPSQSRAYLSETCSPCHQTVYQQYVDSVHGKTLIEADNNDVPVCTDCHRAHEIVDPQTAAFRLQSVKLCSNCHGDEELMQKYGLSADVVTTYLNDFHGRTAALLGKENRDIWMEEAVCSDCHGIHDIKKVDSPDSSVIKANLVDTCRQCHPGANINFPDAWLSHYEPSITKAPLVFLVRWFYWILIPFIIVGISAHIAFDLWKTIKKRK